MKLKAPEGVGNPCVAGVTLLARDEVYEVDAETGALLLECFAFSIVEERPGPQPGRTPRRRASARKN